MAKPASIGSVLDGRFELVEEIARGGMATVFEARDLGDGGRRVAVKMPLPIFGSGIGAWSLFQQEEAIGRRLDHPYVLRFVPLPPDRKRAYVVTELVRGRTLAEHLDEWGPLPESEALAICSRVCEAVMHVHRRGFVHYDLKPANVMLCPDETVRLVDFGLAHEIVRARFSLVGAPPPIASAGYAAPEQVRRRRGRTSVDVYGLGALLFEMLTGRAPFRKDDPFGPGTEQLIGDPPAPRALNPSISPVAEEIALRALRRDPSERYASAAQMKADVDHPELVLVSGLASRLQPATPARRRWRLVRQAALLGVLPVVAQVGLFWILWHHLGPRR
ncbi:MAG TPA: serine/threonine-protein kinase [Polyangia bacterium]|nr:serine/threonine-protein kinase [Polyangia bacterium]